MKTMCNGIAILVYEKNGRLKGLCKGITSHDELCKEDEDLRLGHIEPYRFELLYPANIVFDRAANNLILTNGLFGEQPPREIWDVAFEIGKPFFFKHTKQQLQFANLRSANLTDANLTDANLTDANLMGADLMGANLMGANLTDANLMGADLRGANLRGANLMGANLTNIITNEFTRGLKG